MGFLRRFRGGSNPGEGSNTQGVFQDQETGEITGVKGTAEGTEPRGVFQDQETGEIIGVRGTGEAPDANAVFQDQETGEIIGVVGDTGPDAIDKSSPLLNMLNNKNPELTLQEKMQNENRQLTDGLSDTANDGTTAATPHFNAGASDFAVGGSTLLGDTPTTEGDAAGREGWIEVIASIQSSDTDGIVDDGPAVEPTSLEFPN
jgi:hypothetical protein